jgi:NAD-dependent oxidoreductase involved in siderophore biosynthesis
LLRREAEFLGATYLVVQVDADPSDIRLDGMLRVRARVGFPGVRVSLDSTWGPLTYATDAYEDWRKNVHAIALSMQALRAVDRYGVSRGGEQYKGWTALEMEPSQVAVDHAAHLLATLGASDPAQVRRDPATCRRAYLRAARTYHPDVGGDPEVFRRLTEARDLLEGVGR